VFHSRPKHGFISHRSQAAATKRTTAQKRLGRFQCYLTTGVHRWTSCQPAKKLVVYHFYTIQQTYHDNIPVWTFKQHTILSFFGDVRECSVVCCWVGAITSAGQLTVTRKLKHACTFRLWPFTYHSSTDVHLTTACRYRNPCDWLRRHSNQWCTLRHSWGCIRRTQSYLSGTVSPGCSQSIRSIDRWRSRNWHKPVAWPFRCLNRKP